MGGVTDVDSGHVCRRPCKCSNILLEERNEVVPDFRREIVPDIDAFFGGLSSRATTLDRSLAGSFTVRSQMSEMFSSRGGRNLRWQSNQDIFLSFFS